MFYPKPEKPKKKAPPRRGSPAYMRAKETVLYRDRHCFILRVDPGHTCRDQWGTAHSSYDLHKLTVDHVKRELRFGVRALDLPDFMVAMCWYENDRPPSQEVRDAERKYLAERYPESWPSLDTAGEGDTL